jgi:hypothetical protein
MWTWKEVKRHGQQGPFYWEDTALADFVNESIYDVHHGFDTDTETKTEPWLIWDPEKEAEDSPEMSFVQELEAKGVFKPWYGIGGSFTRTPRPGWPESFQAANFYGHDAWDDVGETARKIAESLGASHEPDKPVPTAWISDLRAIQAEARLRIELRSEALEHQVMRPMRKILIPCAVEAARVTTQFRPLSEVSEERVHKWLETIQDLNHLWSAGIAGGRSFENHEAWLGRAFQHVPEPVAKGAIAAVHVYVLAADDDKYRDLSRDATLESLRPVYYRWQAARSMINSALYQWDFEGLAGKKRDEDILNGLGMHSDNAQITLEAIAGYIGERREAKQYPETFKELHDCAQRWSNNYMNGMITLRRNALAQSYKRIPMAPPESVEEQVHHAKLWAQR